MLTIMVEVDQVVNSLATKPKVHQFFTLLSFCPPLLTFRLLFPRCTETTAAFS